MENRLPEETSIHWHSLEVPVSLDGVPGLVQDFIPPGEAFLALTDIETPQAREPAEVLHSGVGQV